MVTAKKSVDSKKTTTVAAWKSGFDPFLELPSGKVLKVRAAVGFQSLLKAGVIPNSLMGIVQSAMDNGKEPDLSSFTGDTSKINQMLVMIDSIVMFMAVEPEIHEIPPDDEERNSDLLYVDEVEDTDKMFIMQWATGGTRDLEQFRLEAGSVLDIVHRS